MRQVHLKIEPTNRSYCLNQERNNTPKSRTGIGFLPCRARPPRKGRSGGGRWRPSPFPGTQRPVRFLRPPPSRKPPSRMWRAPRPAGSRRGRTAGLPSSLDLSPSGRWEVGAGVGSNGGREGRGARGCYSGRGFGPLAAALPAVSSPSSRHYSRSLYWAQLLDTQCAAAVEIKWAGPGDCFLSVSLYPSLSSVGFSLSFSFFLKASVLVKCQCCCVSSSKPE
jgi:hypothetical protein